MNLSIEIIDGVAYAVEDTPEEDLACESCVLVDTSKCSKARLCNENSDCCHYRHLTAEERVAVQKALGRGME